MRVAATAVLLTLAFAAPAQAIYHGAPEPAASAPWLVALTSHDSAFCGGALIAPDRVLTAAHCVQGLSPQHAGLRIGGGDLDSARTVAWKGAFFPTDYRELPAPFAPTDPNASATMNDVAVIVLAKPVTDVTPLALSPTAAIDGEQAVTVGRGLTGPDAQATPRSPRVAVQSVMTGAECNALYGPKLLHPDLHLCTLADAQACGGDSGSPVMVTRDGVLEEAGVVTWGGETQGRGCGGGPADVSERTFPHLALITGPAPAFAPTPDQRVRVRRHGSTRTCVIGTWTPATATFAVRWFRQGPYIRKTSGKNVIYEPGVKHYVKGHARTLTTTKPVSCEVTARTAGGWDTEQSYNAL